MMITTLDPPKLDRAWIDAQNRLLAHTPFGPFSLAGSTYRLAFPGTVAPFTPALILSVHLGPHHFQLLFEDLEPLDMLHPGDGDFDLLTVPQDLRGLVLETLLEPLPANLESIFECACRIQITTTEPEKQTQPGLHEATPVDLIRDQDGRRAHAMLHCDAQALGFLATKVPCATPRAAMPGDLPLFGHLYLAHMRVTTSEWKALKAADILLLSEANPRPTLHFDDHLVFSGTLEPPSFTVEAPMQTSENVDLPALDPTQLDVHLVFQVGRITMTLGELQGIGPGKILTLDTRTDRPVQVHANGHLVATGELVSVEDRLGVRLLEVNHGRA